MGLSTRKMRDLPVHPSPPIATDGAPSLADITDWITRQRPVSGAEALRKLRTAFPDSPLGLRVAALNGLIHRQNGDAGHTPD